MWFVAAGAFGAYLWWRLNGQFGAEIAGRKTLEYATGYLIEKGLAIENVFVWITIFTYFSIPPEFQKRVLLWGVVGAILMRAVLIYLGALLIQQFSWIFYAFGAFLIITGIKMFLFTGQKSDLGSNPLLRWLRSHLRITNDLHGERFWVIENGKRALTPLFLVLVLVEVTDLIFAVDSIPAIFAVTSDPFIVFTANTPWVTRHVLLAGRYDRPLSPAGIRPRRGRHTGWCEDADHGSLQGSHSLDAWLRGGRAARVHSGESAPATR